MDFELARGYSPSIFGTPRNIVPKDLLDAHISGESLRELERMRREKVTQGIENALIKKEKS